MPTVLLKFSRETPDIPAHKGEIGAKVGNKHRKKAQKRGFGHDNP